MSRRMVIENVTLNIK